ncbi:hypothetical protein SAMN05216327_11899 [Dyadobacter sp. SG02]|nr:hypothetical protein SAMN05216327_11899 [Dyadobacter sp. SG02]
MLWPAMSVSHDFNTNKQIHRVNIVNTVSNYSSSYMFYFMFLFCGLLSGKWMKAAHRVDNLAWRSAGK